MYADTYVDMCIRSQCSLMIGVDMDIRSVSFNIIIFQNSEYIQNLKTCRTCKVRVEPGHWVCPSCTIKFNSEKKEYRRCVRLDRYDKECGRRNIFSEKYMLCEPCSRRRYFDHRDYHEDGRI